MTVARQAAAGPAGLPRAGARAPAAGPGRHRGLRRRGRPGAAVDERRRQGHDPRGDRPAAGRRLDRRRRRHPARLRRRAGALRSGGQQPRHPGHRRRLQRRREHRRGDGAADRAAPRGGHLPDRARLRHRQPEGLEDGADGRQGKRPLRLHRQLPRGAEGVRAGVRRHAVHGREGREDPGRVQPGPGAVLPAAGLREPAAGAARTSRTTGRTPASSARATR